MTVSTADYYDWNARNDNLVAPFNSCSPNLQSLLRYDQKTFGAVSLGCHVDRPVRGGTSMSEHAWGAALDERFPSRQITIDNMNWKISMSAELGINAIHDYTTHRIWYPSKGWHSANIQSGDWTHTSVLPGAWGDGRTVEAKLTGVIPPPVPPPVVYLPHDDDDGGNGLA